MKIKRPKTQRIKAFSHDVRQPFSAQNFKRLKYLWVFIEQVGGLPITLLVIIMSWRTLEEFNEFNLTFESRWLAGQLFTFIHLYPKVLI